jgi:hypothetical protein
LIAVALQLGISRPEALTQEELLDTIRRTSDGEEVPPEPEVPATGGWLLVARHLVARVVEEGLNMPQAARLIGGRTGGVNSVHPKHRAPLPTFTLARIYLAQGYPARARATLQAVVEREPGNSRARALWDELRAQDLAAESAGATVVDAADAALNTDGALALEQTPSSGDASGSPGEAAEGVAPARAEVAEAAVRAEAAPLTFSGARDTLVILRRADQAHIYWELGSASAAQCATQPLRLLICSFQPTPLGAQERRIEVDVTAPSGLHLLTCTSTSQVRSVLGASQGADGSLMPLCVASLRRVTDSGALADDFIPRAGLYDLPVAERALRRLD